MTKVQEFGTELHEQCLECFFRIFGVFFNGIAATMVSSFWLYHLDIQQLTKLIRPVES